MPRPTTSTAAALLALLCAAMPARAQQAAGVVTAVEGRTTLVRARATESTPLLFRAPIFVQDRITTAEHAFARLLLGGRAVVTVRERSIVTITDVPGTAIVDVGRGRIAVSVSKDTMKPGESVEIHTPNAAAGIRGTVVVAEVSHQGSTLHSAITVVRGVVEVTSLDPASRQATGVPLRLGALERARFAGAQAPASERITRDAADALVSEFRLVPSALPAEAADAVKEMVRDRMIQEALIATHPRRPLRAAEAPRADAPQDDSETSGLDDGRRAFGRFGRPEHIVPSPRGHDGFDDRHPGGPKRPLRPREPR